jgi:hypothetical protein
MADGNVCVDNVDFVVENGQLRLNPHAVQSNPQTFEFVLNGAQDVFEKITSFADVVIPLDGYWFITMDAHGEATITGATPGTVVNAEVSAEMRVNNNPVAGTETMLQSTVQGSSSVDQPALAQHGSGSASRLLLLNAGDRVSIWGKRNSDPGTTTQVISNTRGRCRITAIRIGGQ